MKKILWLCLALACSIPNATVPKGYKTCRSDWDCPVDTYCGFVTVDTFAVCKPNTIEFHNPINDHTP